MLGNARAAGARLGERLLAMAEAFDEVLEVRGAGLMWGVELSVPARPVERRA